MERLLKSRRRLLASGLAAAMVAATGLPAQALGRRGGRLVAGLSGAGGDMIGAGEGAFLGATRGALFENLTEIGADGALVGELATDWEPLDGALRWRFALNNRAVFHDGAPLGVDAVVASLRAHQSGLLQNVAQIEPGARGQILLTLHQPDANLPYLLAHPDLFIHQNGLGTGMYQLGAYSETHLLARRVEDHWKTHQAGWFDEVELLALPDPAHRLAALRSGRVDMIDAPDAHGQRLIGANADMILSGDATFAHSSRIATPDRIGDIHPLDNGRFAQRWWVA